MTAGSFHIEASSDASGTLATIAALARSAAIAVAVAVVSLLVLFSINFVLTYIPAEHYRSVAQEAAESGSLSKTHRLMFARSKDVYPHAGNDCLILAALAMPREARLKASLSPRVPALAPESVAPGYPPAGHCLTLAAALKALARDGSADLPGSYYHRYIHGDMTVAMLLLSIMPFATASNVLFASCYFVLAFTTVLAALRLRSVSDDESRHAASIVIIGGTLLSFYALPIFAQSFSFAPTDFIVFGFLLFGLLQPLGRIPEIRLIIAAAIFGALIAIFEFLTGGIPIATALLVALIALGGAPDRFALMRRLSLGMTAFSIAVATCFVAKLLAVSAVWTSAAFSDFGQVLGTRIAGSVGANLPESVRASLLAFNIDPQYIDANILRRIAFTGVMLLYSSFVLGFGSHLIGAMIVIVPAIVLAISIYRMARRGGNGKRDVEMLVLAGAGLIPICWYLLFSNHTILHSFYMVRPLALNFALSSVIIADCSGMFIGTPVSSSAHRRGSRIIRPGS